MGSETRQRTKLIHIRLDEKEYREILEKARMLGGKRPSVSRFARRVMCEARVMDGHLVAGSVRSPGDALAELSTLFAELEAFRSEVRSRAVLQKHYFETETYDSAKLRESDVMAVHRALEDAAAKAQTVIERIGELAESLVGAAPAHV
jgi:hypothetical protein